MREPLQWDKRPGGYVEPGLRDPITTTRLEQRYSRWFNAWVGFACGVWVAFAMAPSTRHMLQDMIELYQKCHPPSAGG